MTVELVLHSGHPTVRHRYRYHYALEDRYWVVNIRSEYRLMRRRGVGAHQARHIILRLGMAFGALRVRP